MACPLLLVAITMHQRLNKPTYIAEINNDSRAEHSPEPAWNFVSSRYVDNSSVKYYNQDCSFNLEYFSR